MVIRAGFLIVALISAIKVCQIASKSSRKPSTSEHEKASIQEEQTEKENGRFGESHVNTRKKEEKDKTCKSNSVDEFSVKIDSEIDLLKNIVKEKEKMRESMEIRLLELYCLKEQQSRISQLQKQLNDRTSELDMLRKTIKTLQDEREKLYEEVKMNQVVTEQLECAKLTILELQGQIELDSCQITMLKEQISGILVEGESEVQNEIDKKLKAIKIVELKALEMKRRNIELQIEKRELLVRLNSAKSKIAELSVMTEHKLVAKHKEEISRLRDVNRNLTEQVDILHRDRLSILEELVYQRWLNSCLRFELEDYRSPSPKNIKLNVRRKLDFRSYSNSSDEVTNTTTASSSSSENSKSKKKGVFQNIMRWRRRKDNLSANSSDRRSFLSKAGKIRRFSTSSMPPSISGLRNRLDSEVQASNSPEMLEIRRVRRVSFNDSINSIRYIYQDSPESDQEKSGNDQKNAENFIECSDMITSSNRGEMLEGKNAEIPSSTFNVQSHEGSADPGNKDTVETEVVSRKEIVQAECLGSALASSASGASKFGELVNMIAALIIVFFVFLVYFRGWIDSNAKG